MNTQQTAQRSDHGRTDSPGGSVSLGLEHGQVIQEFGWDDDVDEKVRTLMYEATGEELVDEDYADVCDAALIWWRDEDGDSDDLADLLVDAKANLDSGSGNIWLMVPAHTTAGAVSMTVIEEASSTAGLSATNAAALSKTWTGVRLSARGPRR